MLLDLSGNWHFCTSKPESKSYSCKLSRIVQQLRRATHRPRTFSISLGRIVLELLGYFQRCCCAYSDTQKKPGDAAKELIWNLHHPGFPLDLRETAKIAFTRWWRLSWFGLLRNRNSSEACRAVDPHSGQAYRSPRQSQSSATPVAGSFPPSNQRKEQGHVHTRS